MPPRQPVQIAENPIRTFWVGTTLKYTTQKSSQGQSQVFYTKKLWGLSVWKGACAPSLYNYLV